jgi:ATP-dependent DNA helicase RecQ
MQVLLKYIGNKFYRRKYMIENALKLLKKYYGYSSFKTGQEKIIESILNKNDTFAIMPTGAGKSICYQIPALIFEGITLVISPLISLMKDQVDSLHSAGIPAAFINSSISYKEVYERIEKAKNKEYKLLYIAPERLESEDICIALKGLDIDMVAVDEAHCVSQWGHDFRPSYKYISMAISKLSKRPVISAFTATATAEVKEDVIRLLDLNEPSVYVTGFNRENLYFEVLKPEDKFGQLLTYLKRNRNKSGLIYAATRKTVESVCQKLTKKGYLATQYHAGLSENERTKNQDNFLYNSQVQEI